MAVAQKLSEAGSMLMPTQSVQQYKSQIMGGQPGQATMPQPRSVFSSTPSKVPYAAKTGSGKMPSGDSAGIFATMPALGQRAAIKKQTLSRSSGGGASQSNGGYRTLSGGQAGGGAYGLSVDSGARIQALQRAYRAQFGTDLPIASGGRSRQNQAYLYDQYLHHGGNLALPPGKSVHESGNAVDFGGAAHGYGPQQTWLVQNAPKFGWYWAGKNFSQIEPWHFERMA